MIRAALLALLLPAAAAAAASGEAAALSADACAEDGTCSVAMLQRVAQKRSACECLTWAETYASGKIKCGDGLEYYGFHQSTLLKVPQEAIDILFAQSYCRFFYERFDSNACVNMQQTSQNGSTWCYVSTACSGDGVEPVPHNQAVRTKRCGAQDKSLRSKTPEELRDMAADLGLDLGFVIRQAYHSEKDMEWGDLQGFWGLGSFGTHPQGEKVPANFKELVHSYQEQSQREYMAFGSDSDNGPIAVVRGDKVYLVERVPGFNVTAEDEEGLKEPKQRTLRCVRGC